MSTPLVRSSGVLGADLLDRHLRQVVNRLETASPIELCAIGIKHDVSPYYARAIRVDTVSALGTALVNLVETHLT